MARERITRQVAEAKLYCDFKAYLMLAGKRGKRSDYGKLHRSLRREYRRDAADFLLQGHSDSRVTRAPESVIDAIDEGNTLILCAVLVTGAFSFTVDALVSDAERSEAQSELIPLLFSYSEKPSRHDKELLAMSAVLLERVSGRQSQHGTLLYGRSFRKSTVTISKLRDGASESLRYLESISHGDTPRRHLNDHCKACQYDAICRREAEKTDDLSLLRGISPKEVARLNKRGIFTVNQYSYTYRARRRRSRKNSRPSKHERSLNALAIRTDSIYVAHTPEIPEASVEVFLDIEGLPHRNFYYLLGATVVRGKKRHSVAFWADAESSERDLWFGFARLLEEFDDACIFHYGTYDAQALSRLSRRYDPTSSLLDRLDGATFNVLSAIYGKVHFPCYANDLKSVATSLGFSWKTPGAGGIDSIVWRHKWETSGNEDLKTRLVEYNDDDRSALVVVVDALRRLQTPGDASLLKPALEVNQLRSEHTYTLIRTSAALPDLEMINRRSYFDYLRQRVTVRTESSRKRGARPSTRRKRRAARVDRVIKLDRPSTCPNCESDLLYRHGPLQTTVHDLAFTQTGVKRANLRYKSHRYRCRKCLRAFTPAQFRIYSSRKYGHGLVSWLVYHNIEMRQSGSSIVGGLRSLFGYEFHRGLANRLKRDAADFYSATYSQLQNAILHSDVVYADETPMRVRKGQGYVWVFASNDAVVYVYSGTRGADTPQTVLDGFNGVLVSDFYAAYNAIPCRQQKCLIHLIRDLNDALLRNPFDNEIKRLTHSLTGLMVPIVKTIDKYGLRKKYLAKHRKEAKRFLDDVRDSHFTSENAVAISRRILSEREKLFTFLDCDNVAWSNNNAEHAVKRFAMLRNVIGYVSTADGLEEYLILLSICETLRRRGVDFLRFLQSQSTDLPNLT